MRLRRGRDQRGAATIEFYIVAFLVLVPLTMGVLQMGMFMVAKNTVNVAALATARAGAASGADKAEMKRAYAVALAPLYVSKGIGSLGGAALADVNTANYSKVMLVAFTRARLEAALPLNTITVLNPTLASFTDFGVGAGTAKVIPVTGLLNDFVVGAASKQTRADALLLKVEVRYCYEMVFPIIDDMIAKTLSFIGAAPADLACYARKPGLGTRGVPIVAQAVVRMTVPPVRGNF